MKHRLNFAFTYATSVTVLLGALLATVSFTLIAPSTAVAQSLPTITVGTASGVAGGVADLSVQFTQGGNAGPSDDVSSLQFDLVLPSSLTYANVITDGSATVGAGKSSTASVVGSTLRVIIFGLNSNTFGSGPLVTVRLNIAPGAASGAQSISPSGIVFSSPLGANVAGTGVAGSVTVVGLATPTPTATPRPTSTPTPRPTGTPTPRPTGTPTATATATPRPTGTATPRPTATSTPRPTGTATPRPTATSTPRPTGTATPRPTASATPRPTGTATPRPTATPAPTSTATAAPTPSPTAVPNQTPVPTVVPTPEPSATPSPTPIGDTDGDGISDDKDNCPQTSNVDQVTLPGHTKGAACDREFARRSYPDFDANRLADYLRVVGSQFTAHLSQPRSRRMTTATSVFENVSFAGIGDTAGDARDRIVFVKKVGEAFRWYSAVAGATTPFDLGAFGSTGDTPLFGCSPTGNVVTPAVWSAQGVSENVLRMLGQDGALISMTLSPSVTDVECGRDSRGRLRVAELVTSGNSSQVIVRDLSGKELYRMRFSRPVQGLVAIPPTKNSSVEFVAISTSSSKGVESMLVQLVSPKTAQRKVVNVRMKFSLNLSFIPGTDGSREQWLVIDDGARFRKFVVWTNK